MLFRINSNITSTVRFYDRKMIEKSHEILNQELKKIDKDYNYNCVEKGYQYNIKSDIYIQLIKNIIDRLLSNKYIHSVVIDVNRFNIRFNVYNVYCVGCSLDISIDCYYINSILDKYLYNNIYNICGNITIDYFKKIKTRKRGKINEK